jgi:hypothetical protein
LAFFTGAPKPLSEMGNQETATMMSFLSTAGTTETTYRRGATAAAVRRARALASDKAKADAVFSRSH